MQNDKIQFSIGFVLGLIACAIGVMIYLHFVTQIELSEAITFLKREKLFGKVMAIGCITNLLLFFSLLKLKKDFMAKGVIMSVIVLAIGSIFL